MQAKAAGDGMGSFSIRKLLAADADHVASVLRTSFDERLPWLAGLHTPEEDRNFVRDNLFENCSVWGAEDGELIGIIAFRSAWVDQLYVLPGRQGEGIGRALLALAKMASPELCLWTFQRNDGARKFYEHEGFVAIEKTDGRRTEEREPDVLYRWRSDR